MILSACWYNNNKLKMWQQIYQIWIIYDDLRYFLFRLVSSRMWAGVCACWCDHSPNCENLIKNLLGFRLCYVLHLQASEHHYFSLQFYCTCAEGDSNGLFFSHNKSYLNACQVRSYTWTIFILSIHHFNIAKYWN